MSDQISKSLSSFSFKGSGDSHIFQKMFFHCVLVFIYSISLNKIFNYNVLLNEDYEDKYKNNI